MAASAFREIAFVPATLAASFSGSLASIGRSLTSDTRSDDGSARSSTSGKVPPPSDSSASTAHQDIPPEPEKTGRPPRPRAIGRSATAPSPDESNPGPRGNTKSVRSSRSERLHERKGTSDSPTRSGPPKPEKTGSRPPRPRVIGRSATAPSPSDPGSSPERQHALRRASTIKDGDGRGGSGRDGGTAKGREGCGPTAGAFALPLERLPIIVRTLTKETKGSRGSPLGELFGAKWAKSTAIPAVESKLTDDMEYSVSDASSTSTPRAASPLLEQHLSWISKLTPAGADDAAEVGAVSVYFSGTLGALFGIGGPNAADGRPNAAASSHRPLQRHVSWASGTTGGGTSWTGGTSSVDSSSSHCSRDTAALSAVDTWDTYDDDSSEESVPFDPPSTVQAASSRVRSNKGILRNASRDTSGTRASSVSSFTLTISGSEGSEAETTEAGLSPGLSSYDGGGSEAASFGVIPPMSADTSPAAAPFGIPPSSAEDAQSLVDCFDGPTLSMVSAGDLSVRERIPLGGPKYYVAADGRSGRARVVHGAMPRGFGDGEEEDDEGVCMCACIGTGDVEVVDETGYEVIDYRMALTRRDEGRGEATGPARNAEAGVGDLSVGSGGRGGGAASLSVPCGDA